jgi:hypothetical protein
MRAQLARKSERRVAWALQFSFTHGVVALAGGR